MPDAGQGRAGRAPQRAGVIAFLRAAASSFVALALLAGLGWLACQLSASWWIVLALAGWMRMTVEGAAAQSRVQESLR